VLSDAPNDAEESELIEDDATGQAAPGPPKHGLSRRDFLRTAALVGVGVGVGGLAYVAASQSSSSSTTAGVSAVPEPTPGPSGVVDTVAFRSRPDLWSPIISVGQAAADVAGGVILLTPHGGSGPLIVDNSGSPIWIRPVAGRRTFNLRMASYRGAPVLTWWEGDVVRGTGQGEYVIVDTGYREVARVQAQNGLHGDLHEFILTPQGTALFTVFADHPVPPAFAGLLPTPPPSPSPAPNLPRLFESIVQEVDVETGRLLFEWHSADHVGLDETYAVPPNNQSFDFFHANSIDLEPDGNLLISARHTCALYKVDRRSGEIIWRLGGKRSDFAMGPGAGFAWQHDARRQLDGTITVFDDGSSGGPPPNESQSRGIRLAVDETAMTATLVAAYTRPSVLAKSQGSMQPLANGNVFVGWGDQPSFTEFRADGSVVMDAHLPVGATSYRALRFDWSGTGDGAPSVAGNPVAYGLTVVYASWNGATDVAEWLVLGGDAAESLTPLAARRRTGFETAITVSGQPAFVSVRALASTGRPLGDSPIIPISQPSLLY
jgi:Arylsulfotransferase (ASST)